MSEENVEIVRRFSEPYNGEDVIPLLRASVELLGPEPEPEAVLSLWASDPSWRYVHPEIEWDTTAVGPVGVPARGPVGVARFWAEWSDTWESYVYRVSEYRDLGEWILTPVDVRATGRGGIPVKMRSFQMHRIRDGKIETVRAFGSERAALEAAGVSE
jgi:SnoaL-like domain